MATVDQVQITLPPWAEAYRQPARYLVAYGGRGSSKSWVFARMALIAALASPIRILCCRELQTSIRDSVLQLLREQIDMCGLNSYFDVGANYLKCPASGSEFLFKGLRSNSQEIKSTEGVDICWVEEAQAVSEESWQVLIPTIRKPGSQIWVSFNPALETDPTYQRYVVEPPSNAIVKLVNWQDNPWFPDVLRDEMEHMRRTDMDAYLHIWEGQCVLHTEAQVLAGKVVSDAFEPGHDWDGPYYGADWGYSVDPTTLIKLWIHGRKLYVEHEAYGNHVDMDALPGLFDTVPGSRSHVIRADNARPETIAYMVQRGFRCYSASKGKGSVEDGIAQLRGFESIVVHPRCTHALEESRLWQYKVDRLSGDVMPVLKPGNDHCWDAARYALEPLLGGVTIAKPAIPYTPPPAFGGLGWMA